MIYSIGDSFMAGEELLDPFLIINYPPLCTLSSTETEIEKNLNWYREKVINTRSKDEVDSILKESKELAYPAVLGKICNLPVINNAQPGASIDYIANKMIIDLLQLKSENKQVKLVIVQLTSILRKYFAYNGELINCVLTFDGYEHSLLELIKSFLINENEYTLYKQWLFNVIKIYDFCKNNNYKLIIDVRNDFANTGDISDLVNKYTDLYSLEKYVQTKFFNLSEIQRKLDSKGTPTVLCGGHYSPKVHEEMAKEIYTYIQNEI